MICSANRSILMKNSFKAIQVQMTRKKLDLSIVYPVIAREARDQTKIILMMRVKIHHPTNRAVTTTLKTLLLQAVYFVGCWMKPKIKNKSDLMFTSKIQHLHFARSARCSISLSTQVIQNLVYIVHSLLR